MKSKLRISISILITLFTAVIFTACASSNQTAIKVSDKFLDDLQKKQYEDARSLLSVEGQKEYDAEKLKQVKLPEKPAIQQNPEIGANQAKIVYGDKETKRYIEITVIKENKKWVVSKLQSYILNY